MSYTAYTTKRGKTFATLTEARKAASEFARKTGIIVAVEETRRKVTHKYDFFRVPYGSGYQHGTEIYTITGEEYERRPYPGAYFDSYTAAIYYTMD